MSNLDYASVRRFYRHSGKIPPVAIVAGLTAAATTGAILGPMYGALGLWAHLIPAGKLMFLGEVLLATGLAFGIAAIPTLVLRKFKARSIPAALACTFITFLVAYYFAWIFWIYVLSVYWGDPAPLGALFRPDVLGTVITGLNHDGVWSISKDDTPKETFLWVIWGIEAATILIGALVCAKNAMTAKMYCEHCQTWGTQRPLMQLRGAAWPDMEKGLAVGDIQPFETAGPPAPADNSFLSVSLEGCATCDNLQAINIERTTITADKKGRVNTTKKQLVRRQLITPEQTAQLALVAASLAAPAPTPPETPATPPPAAPTAA